MMDQRFRQLAADGVTALRLFARARVGNDVLDLCGKLNLELQQVFHRAYAAARPHGIRFLQRILPEPGSSTYVSRSSVERRVLPRFSKEELAKLIPSQRRFIEDGKRITMREFFTDPDVLACQKLYLEQAMDWIGTEPQVFAVEIYNEQGWNGRQYQFPVENAEIRWSKEIVAAIKKRAPWMLVTLSHPGFGITGYDPFNWVQGAGVDFYLPHAYTGLSGESQRIFAAYQRSLDVGVPIRFGLNQKNGMSLEKFAALDPALVQRPIQAIGGYQMTYLKDARNPLWMAYFRKRKTQRFGSHWVGVPDTAPLEIRIEEHRTQNSEWRGLFCVLSSEFCIQSVRPSSFALSIRACR
jgi:hypothetical protein